MRSPEEAGAYVRKLRAILRYVGSCDGNMEQGSMRADVNVSVRKPGGPLGTRTETKNVNSVRFIMAAIEYEANRQVDVLEGGGTIVQETRLFDPDKGETRSLRSKEEAHDYRYFPDPDLLPVELDEDFLEECRACSPSSPTPSAAATRQRSASPPTMPACSPPRSRPRAGSSCCSRRARQDRADVASSAEQLGDLRPVRRPQPPRQEHRGQPGHARAGAPSCSASSPTAPFPARSPSRCSRSCSRPARIPAAIVEERGLRQTSDTGAIEAVIADVLAANPDKVAEYRGGKDKLFGFFVGQVMKAMRARPIRRWSTSC